MRTVVPSPAPLGVIVREHFAIINTRIHYLYLDEWRDRALLLSRIPPLFLYSIACNGCGIMDAIAQYGSSEEDGEEKGGEGHQALSSSNHRVRNFPHVQGNYATHVYIEVSIPQRCCDALRALVVALQAASPSPFHPLIEPTPQSLLPSKNACESPTRSSCGSYHISLSRTVAIRSHQIKSLLTQLRHQLRRLKRFSVIIASQNMMVLENDEKTSTFVALSAGPITYGAEHPTNPLLRAMDAVSNAFQYHGLQRYYENPRPHVSIGWMLGAQSQQVTDTLTANACVQFAHQHLQKLTWTFECAEIICKIGQKSHVVWRTTE